MSTPTYVLNCTTFAVTSEAGGHYVLCVCMHLWPFLSQRLIHRWLCLSPLVVKVQPSQLIYLNWEWRYGWVWVGHSPQNKHPNPPTPGPTQILAGFKLFLVMSEPCALPAYQKTDSTQATPPLLPWLWYSFCQHNWEYFHHLSKQHRPRWQKLSFISRTVSRPGIFPA